MISARIPKAKAAYWYTPDTQGLKRGEQTGLDKSYLDLIEKKVSFSTVMSGLASSYIGETPNNIDIYQSVWTIPREVFHFEEMAKYPVETRI